MNDELHNLERRLEQATAPECPAEALTDPEVAAWREGWLALGPILESIEPPAEDLLTKIIPPASIVRPRRPVPVVSALIAASLLIGISLFGLLRSASVLHEPSGDQNQVARTESVALPKDITGDDDLRWDDNWDQQLAVLSDQLALVQNEGDGWTADYIDIRSRVDTLQQELENNSL
jgi:hypothetical protein